MTQRTDTNASLDRTVDAPDRRRLPPLLRSAWYSLNQAFRRRLLHAKLQLTPDQFTVLRWLSECGPQGITQRQLCDLMASDPNTIVSLLNRMQANRLLDRTRHERDRRANRIRLTTVGQRTYRQARKIAVDLQSEVLASLPAKQRERFLESLDQVADACQKALIDS